MNNLLIWHGFSTTELLIKMQGTVTNSMQNLLYIVCEEFEKNMKKQTDYIFITET